MEQSKDALNDLLQKSILGDIVSIKEIEKIIVSFQVMKPTHTDIFTFYTDSATKGNSYAECLLGEMYLFGIGTPIDTKHALNLLEKSVSQNNFYAQYYLALQYLDLEIPEVDIDTSHRKAYELMKLSAEQNYPEAQYYLGYLYQIGRGTALNYPLAEQNFLLAAEGSFSSAHHDLIALYTNFEYYPKDADMTKIYRWYMKRIYEHDEVASGALHMIIQKRPSMWKFVINESLASHKKIHEMENLIEHMRYAPNGYHYNKIEDEFYTLAAGSCRKR
ncbi:MAG: hypothetical protein Harvfovirus53_5 [Harvfovirus sp.]|uniref:Sel1 repeat family protein n=1 Tax=Harvfovirus sp. TaxID=2487768 RepID=A0A3G5A393_9VIRU|nr:MAG: hypothetical protein Harvfovirus53_5 [Harvfovirus sp.]